MMDLNGSLEPMMKELRLALSQIKGVKALNEDLTIEYLAVVETEDEKDNVEKVGAVLSAQAETFGFSLEITAATQAEVDEAEKKYGEFLVEQTQFKA